MVLFEIYINYLNGNVRFNEVDCNVFCEDKKVGGEWVKVFFDWNGILNIVYESIVVN